MKKPSKMTAAKFEKSAKDKKMDKAGAKKAGTTLKAWEGSKADRKADRKADKKAMKRK